jgi:hypothetical protein
MRRWHLHTNYDIWLNKITADTAISFTLSLGEVIPRGTLKEIDLSPVVYVPSQYHRSLWNSVHATSLRPTVGLLPAQNETEPNTWPNWTFKLLSGTGKAWEISPDRWCPSAYR